MVCLMGVHTLQPLSTSQGVSEFHFDGFLRLVSPLQAYVDYLKIGDQPKIVVFNPQQTFSNVNPVTISQFISFVG